MNQATIAEAGQYYMNTYASFPLVFTRGEGCYLYDDNNRGYLDFVAGIAVNSLGYGHPAFVQRVGAQLSQLCHVSNLFYNPAAIRLAEKLVRHSGMQRVFFCNSGAEAVEAALKLARIYAKTTKSSGAYHVVSMNNSFHGRTFAALSVTGQTKYHKNFEPLLPAVSYAEFNDIDDLRSKITPETAAVILEPVQGEGGICPADPAYLAQVRQLCDEENIVLIFDEVQTGIGRTGSFFAYQHYGVKPDIVAAAKGLAGGIPMGAILAPENIAAAFTPGTHASTFGGNALAATAALVVVEELMENGLLEAVRVQSSYLRSVLEELSEQFPRLRNVRGLGLMLGAEVEGGPAAVVAKAQEKGLLLVGAGPSGIRFVPPLTVTRRDIDAFRDIFAAVLEEVQ